MYAHLSLLVDIDKYKRKALYLWPKTKAQTDRKGKSIGEKIVNSKLHRINYPKYIWWMADLTVVAVAITKPSDTVFRYSEGLGALIVFNVFQFAILFKLDINGSCLPEITKFLLPIIISQ